MVSSNVFPRLVVDDVAYRRVGDAKPLCKISLGNSLVCTDLSDKAYFSQVELDPFTAPSMISNRQRLKVARTYAQYAAVALFNAAVVKFMSCWNRADMALVNQDISSVRSPLAHLSAVAVAIAAMLPYPAPSLRIFNVFRTCKTTVMSRAIPHGLSRYQRPLRVAFDCFCRLNAAATSAKAKGGIWVVLGPPLTVLFSGFRYTVAHAMLLSERRARGGCNRATGINHASIIPDGAAI